MKLATFINRPVLSTVISIFIVILGLIGLSSLPVEQYPDIAPPTVRVSTTYSGANAQTVLNTVIAPLEESINGALNMTYMTSSATNNGNAEISVYFKQGYDPDMAAIDVQNRVSQATSLLPAEVTRVGVVTQKRQTSMLVGIALYSESDDYNIDFLENYMAINVVPQIKRIPGVGEALTLGADYSMRVWLKPDVMAQYNLMPSDITAALADQNIEAAPGQFGERGNQSFQYVLRYKGRLSTPEEFENIVVRAGSDGKVLYLGDVADVELGRLTYGFENTVNGKVGVTSIVFQSPGSNASEIIEEVLKVVEDCEKNLPKGLKFTIPMNVDIFLQASIHELLKTLIEAFFLVFVVVYLFLQDLRSTLIPAIAIPVALVGTFSVLYAMGFSLNLLTLAALVLAIAIVVDDAIVVVEAVHAKLDEGYKSARQASIDAMSEIGSAIFSITLVMMLVFIPVSFMPGTEGVFYRQFGITMAIAIAISAINALTLSPALCAILLKPHSDDPNKKTTFVKRFHTAFNTHYERLLARYRGVVDFFIKAKSIVWIIVIGGVALLAWLMSATPSGLVPNEDTGTVMGVVGMPPGTSQERTLKVMHRLDSLVGSIPAVESRVLIQGYSFLGGQGNTYGSMIIRLKDWSLRGDGESSEDIVKQLYGLTAQFVKDGTIMFFTPPMITGYGASNGFEVQLQDKTGGDINRFFEIEQTFLAALNQRPEIQMAYSSFNPTYPQYLIDVDAAKCAKAGIGTSTVLGALQGYIGSMYVSNVNRFGKMYRVMMQANPESRVSPESLNAIKVRTAEGMTPINNFISLKRVYGPDLLNRFNLFTSITVNGTPNPQYTSGEAIAAIQEVAAQVLPQGYSYEYSGLTREEASNAEGSTGIIFVLCFVFVYLILSALYESYILPLAVILSIPFGLMGSFLFANIFDVANNIYLKISLIMLIGLLAKNAILIVEFALDRRKQGMNIVSAAVAAASARLRPILMTSLAMIIGLLPLLFANGVGANGNNTLGAGSVGGMLIGTLSQVFVVPTLFVIFETIQEKLKPIKWKDTNPVAVTQEIQQYESK